MPVAPNIPALKRRLDRFFYTKAAKDVDALQSMLIGNLREFPRVVVIGGLVRDFAREGRKAFRSDVDLVIDASSEDVNAFAKRLGATPNKFGGYRFHNAPWQIDFWALETTWSARESGVKLTEIEDVLMFTFFDWDAIAYDLRRHLVIGSDDYLDRIRSKILDINLSKTPTPENNLLRAVRRLTLWGVHAGPQLRKFIEEHLDDVTLRELQRKEKKQRHLEPVTSRWSSALSARRMLLGKSSHGGRATQPELPHIQVTSGD